VTEPVPPDGALVRPIKLGHANAFLIRGKRPVLVDTGLPGNTPAILAVLKEEGYSPWDLGLIIITHAHIDHFGNAGALAGATGAPVLVHSQEAEALSRGESLPAVPASFTGKVMRFMIGKHAPRPELGIKAVIRVDAPYRLDAFGIDGEILPTPGHTGGSLSVILGTGEAIVGDLVMGMVLARKATLPHFAEASEDVKKSIRTVTEKKPAIVYTGHGGPFSCRDLEALIPG
jgi:glyoxylase-like metal-dependent hydrolase (beta-lactamase superfamily II)